jgi:glycosyltransferase involved in cell wall biosynthesis
VAAGSAQHGKARVLFLAYHFPPIGGGGVQRSVKFARYLPEHGYEPVVVTGPGEAFDHWTPHDGTLGAELPDGIEVHRVPGPEPPLSKGRRRRAERLLGLQPAFARWWNERAVELGCRVGRDADLVYCAVVPYESAEAAATIARLLDKPWVADLQDPWALDEMWIYPTGIHRGLDRRRMRRLLASADAVVMNTPEAARRVVHTFPELAARQVATIPNGFDGSDFAGPVPERDDGVFRIVHTGYLHTEAGRRHRQTAHTRRLLGGAPIPGVDILTRSHVYLLEAVDRLLAEDPALRSTIEVWFVGVLSDADREVAARSRVTRTTGYLAHGESVALLRSADLLFLPMHDLPPGTRAGLVPGKTYEYLATGKPILAAVPDGDARDLLTEAGSARICRPTDSAAMAKAISAEIELWRAGRRAPPPSAPVVARYERRRQTAELARVLDSVLARSEVRQSASAAA